MLPLAPRPQLRPEIGVWEQNCRFLPKPGEKLCTTGSPGHWSGYSKHSIPVAELQYFWFASAEKPGYLALFFSFPVYFGE